MSRLSDHDFVGGELHERCRAGLSGSVTNVGSLFGEVYTKSFEKVWILVELQKSQSTTITRDEMLD